MSSFGKTLVRSRPGKVAWAVAATTIALGQLPFWLVYSIPKQLRPHPKWTYLQAISNRLLRAFVYHVSFMEMQTPLRLEPAAEKERFVIIKPAVKDLYRGILENADVQPAVTGGTWFPNLYKPKPGDEQSVVLYLHGGAFVIGEGRSADAGFPGKTLAENLNANVLSISYRLSSNPGCHFPAALQDAVTAYHYLLHESIEAKRIIIAGDSAGANLAVALLRYIVDSEGILPQPAAAILCSPWVDLDSARDPAILNEHRNYTTDFVPGNFTEWGAKSYEPRSMNAAYPYLSPLNHPFNTKTPLFVCFGGLEMLYDQCIAFAKNMKTAGNDVEIHIEPYASHAFLNVGDLTGFTAEAENSVRLAREWMSKNRIVPPLR